MTALNVFLEPNQVHVCTDTAGVRRNGRIVEWMNKAHAMPHWPGVIAARGRANVLAMAVQRFKTYQTFDEAMLSAKLATQTMSWFAFDLVLAGWSAERRQPEAFHFYSAGGLNNYRVKIEPIREVFLAPHDEGLAERVARHGVVMERIEADRDAYLLMNEQRAIPHQSSFTKNGAIAIGGACILTSVDQFAVTSRRMGSWPDAIGAAIANGT